MSFFWDALSSLTSKISSYLSWFGFSDLEARIVLLGLDNAGKTTLLSVLRNNKVSLNIPTQQATQEEFLIDGITINVCDLGGHKAARKVWKEYCHNIDAIIFIIDSSEQNRFNESKNELWKLLQFKQLNNIPFLILGNKIDKKSAVSESQLKYYFKLDNSMFYTKNNKNNKNNNNNIRSFKLFMCSITKRIGIKDAMQWLSNQIRINKN